MYPNGSQSRHAVRQPEGPVDQRLQGFICQMDRGWFVEDARGEAGPFSDLREAQRHLEQRRRSRQAAEAARRYSAG